MVSDLDIFRTAAILIAKHGDRAQWQAAAHIDRQIAKGDPAGEAVWKRVARAVETLQREPEPGSAKH